jgi:hypothetical protein
VRHGRPCAPSRSEPLHLTSLSFFTISHSPRACAATARLSQPRRGRERRRLRLAAPPCRLAGRRRSPCSALCWAEFSVGPNNRTGPPRRRCSFWLRPKATLGRLASLGRPS